MKRFLWLLILALALGLAWLGITRALVPTSAAALVTRGKAVQIVTGSVTVAADAQSSLVSPSSGIVLADDYNLAVGREVKKDDLLAKLDAGDIPTLMNNTKLELDRVNEQLAPDKPLPSEILRDITQKEVNEDAAILQQDSDFMPKADFERLQQTLAQQKAVAQNDRADLQLRAQELQNNYQNYGDQLKRLEIRAPYDGYITAVYIHPGDWTDKGGNVADFISKQLKIQAEVNQDDIAAVHEQETANISFFAYPDKTFPATVTRVLPSSDKETQRFTVLLQITDAALQGQLLAGLTGEVNFTAGEKDNALLIPRRALFSNSVVVAKDGRVEVRPVKTGILTMTQAEITSGVSEGDAVLTENLDLFRTGDHVRLTNDPAAKQP